jgi:pimeloyl-ACP methyl ester carboxylesterase
MSVADDAGPLVILPPLGVSASGTAELASVLSEGRPTMQYEFPGHGLMPTTEQTTIARLGSDLVRLLEQRNITRASLCGCGFGGMVALWVAAHHPERVSRLSVICSSGTPGNEAGYRTRAANVRQHGLLALGPEIVAGWVTPARATADIALMQRLQAMLGSVDPDAYAACCEAITGLDLSPDLANIRAPTLVLAASEDRGLPPKHSRQLAERIRDATYSEVEAAAHLPWLEQPKAVLDAIGKHLGGVSVHSI